MPRTSTVVVMALALAAPCVAQDQADLTRTPWRGAMLPRQWKPVRTNSDALRVPSPITRDEHVERVTLKDTIALALSNNPGIAARRLEPTRQSEAVLGAQAQYDPTLSGEVQSVQTTTPNASSLAGTTSSNIDDRTADFHLFKTFRSGTLATIDFLNERLDNNARFNQLRPEYITHLNLSLVQPLLRNFGWDFSYLVVRVAEENADASVYQYQAALADFVEQVIEAYWNVVRARENVEVQHESKALADRTVEENQARVRVGLLPPVAVLEAQADAAAREQQVITAENDLDIARQTLAQLAYYRPDDTFVPRTLEPIEDVTLEDVNVSLDDTIATAVAERPEIAASARGVSVQLLNERIAGNALLPRLDLIGSYGVNGLSGRPRAVTGFGSLSQTFFSPTDLTGTRAGLACQPLAPPATASFICVQSGTATSGSPRFAGPPSEAYERLTSNDFRSYSFGVQFEVPLSNAAARSQFAQSRISRSQAELNHRQLLSQVTLDARQAVANVTSARKSVDTTRVARELAEENLRNQEKRHEVGMATTKDLLDFQTRLTTARSNEVTAKTNYAIALAQWRRAEGRLLAYYQVVVEQPGRRSLPWFARF